MLVTWLGLDVVLCHRLEHDRARCPVSPHEKHAPNLFMLEVDGLEVVSVADRVGVQFIANNG
jgi:hypothetical protein